MKSINAGLVFTLAVTVFGQTGIATGAKAPMPTTLKFLAATQIDPARLLPPPAQDGSAAQQKEMAEVKDLIHTRSKERYVQAVWEPDMRILRRS